MPHTMHLIKTAILYLIPAPVVASAISDVLHGNPNAAPFLLAIAVMYYAIMRKVDSLTIRVVDLETHMRQISKTVPRIENETKNKLDIG